VSLDSKSIDEMIEMDLASWKNINAGTVELMEDVKKAGYLLAILSNMPHDFLAWGRKCVPAFSLPHVGLFSCEVNIIKPEEAIYRKLLSLLNTKSQEPLGFAELVFFDDNAENIKSARALGIEAILWENPENARRELESLGVKL
jgi:putative hydrolase of the HAD superfamily